MDSWEGSHTKPISTQFPFFLFAGLKTAVTEKQFPAGTLLGISVSTETNR